jgi:4-amino-4-deoxy-L-arabinose transferase-like glycosyltransferase
MDLDEPRYGESAREMLILKDYIIPHLNFEPRVNKPILFYWLIMLSYKLLGISEFSTRLPSAISGLGMVIFVYIFVSRQLSEEQGFVSALILASTPMFLVISRIAIIDSLYSVLIFVSLCFLWLYFKNEKFVIPAFLCMGFSMSTKGPAGVCIIFLAVLLFSLMEKRVYYIKKFFNPWGIGIFLISGFFWYLLLILRIGWTEFKHLALTETIGRFKWGFVHQEPIYYFLPIIFVGFFPWALYLFKLKITRIWQNPFLRYILCYTVGGLVFFSLSRTKLPNYISPIFPGLAVLVAPLVVEFRNKRNKVFFVLAFLLISIGIGVIFYGRQLSKIISNNEIWKISLLFFILGAISLLGARLDFKYQFIFLFLLIPFIYFYLLIQYGDDYSDYRSAKGLFEKQSLEPNEDIYALGFFKPSLVFYSQRKVVVVDNIQKAGKYLVVKNAELPKYIGKVPFYVLSHNKKYTLVKLQKLHN